MASVVADTHAAVWYLANDPRLSRIAGQAMDETTAAGDRILIPAISLVELTYLVEKGRLPQSARQRLIDAVTDPEGPYDLVPLDQIVAEAVERIDRAVVPDLPDRVIAATALAWNVALVSRDGKIRTSQIQTIW
jgi:PIN domain nuclease of toxin-antitoxin system